MWYMTSHIFKIMLTKVIVTPLLRGLTHKTPWFEANLTSLPEQLNIWTANPLTSVTSTVCNVGPYVSLEGRTIDWISEPTDRSVAKPTVSWPHGVAVTGQILTGLGWRKVSSAFEKAVLLKRPPAALYPAQSRVGVTSLKNYLMIELRKGLFGKTWRLSHNISLSTVVRNASKNPPFRLDPEESGRERGGGGGVLRGVTFGSLHIGMIGCTIVPYLW